METEITYSQWLAELETFTVTPAPTDAVTSEEWAAVWGVPVTRARGMLKKAVRANFMTPHRVPCVRMDGVTSLTSGYALNPPKQDP